MKIRNPFLFVLLLAILGLAATTYYRHQRLLASQPHVSLNWVDTRLYFGLGPDGDPAKGVSEQAWRDFLDTEVTPRFPAGLSVLDVYGQWQRTPQSPTERERSKLLVIDYPDTPDNNAKIEAIRQTWKQRTGAQSVLKVTQPADVSF